MHKGLAVFALLLFVLCLQTKAQSDKAQQTQAGENPTFPIADAVTQQSDRPNLKSNHQEHDETYIRVIATPPKDRYDKAAVWVNVGLAIVGVCGIIVAIITLRKVERQTKATEDAVLEAQTARALAEDTAKRQLRAYVGLVVNACWNLQSNGPFGIRFQVFNFGQTPASTFNALGVIDYLPYPLPEDYTLPDLPPRIRQDGMIFQNSTQNPMTVSFWEREDSRKTVEDKWKLLSRNSPIEAYAHGRITYCDVFGREQFVDFCYFLNPDSVRTNDIGGIIRESDGNVLFQWAPVAGRNRMS